jgi:hypothetical protein
MKNHSGKRFGVRTVVIVAAAIAVAFIVCTAVLFVWDYLEDIGIIPAGL